MKQLYRAIVEITFLIELADFSFEKPDICVLLPMFNEARRIENCVREVETLSSQLTKTLMGKIESIRLSADTEMVVGARRSGFLITAIGVGWTELRQRGKSKINLLRESLKMGAELLKLRLNMGRETPNNR